jgi:hypothetical protein
VELRQLGQAIISQFRAAIEAKYFKVLEHADTFHAFVRYFRLNVHVYREIDLRRDEHLTSPVLFGCTSTTHLAELINTPSRTVCRHGALLVQRLPRA